MTLVSEKPRMPSCDLTDVTLASGDDDVGDDDDDDNDDSW